MKTIYLFFTSLIASTAWANSAESRVFFAKVNETLIPLSTSVFSKSKNNFNIFSYGDPLAVPTEFSLTSTNHAYGRNQEVVGFVKSLFVVGSTVNATVLKLDSDHKLLNGQFYSCKEAGSSKKHNIFYQMQRRLNPKRCFKVDIYFLLYEHRAPSAEAGKNVNKVSLEGHPKTKSVSGNLPYVFFAKINGVNVPLGARVYSNEGVLYSYMCYGPEVGDPIEFYTSGSSAISFNTDNDGFIGLHDKNLAFGPTMTASDLMLDQDRKLHNAQYFSCEDVDNFQFITTFSIAPFCFPVDIYLLQKDAEATNASEELNKTLPKKKAVENRVTLEKGKPYPAKTKSRPTYPARAGLTPTYSATTKWNPTYSATTELTPTYSARNKWSPTYSATTELSDTYSKCVMAHVLYVKIDDKFVPLSAKDFSFMGSNFSVMIHGSKQAHPVSFILVNDQYAIGVGTKTVGYLGYSRNMLAFGPNISRERLYIGPLGQILSDNFYSCPIENDSNHLRLIADEMISDSCYEVKIFMRFPIQSTMEPVTNPEIARICRNM